MRVAVISLGCPKNLVDSEVIIGLLLKNRYSLTNKWHSADAVIINTCAFIKSAVRESEQWIKEVLAYKKFGHIKKVIVTGCLVERYREVLLKKFSGLDSIVGINENHRLPQILKAAPEKILISSPPSSLYTFRTPRLLTTNSFAYVKIADGCNNFCSYCLIPSLRGYFRSRAISDVVNEAQHLVNQGFKELVLVAQDTTLYGKDLYNKLALSDLLKQLTRLKNLVWLRLLYTHPAHFTDELVEVFRDTRKLCRYVDLPIQHISNRILILMNRKYTGRDIRILLDKLYKIPEMAVRSTVIVGFPSETDKEFQKLLDFISEARFTHLGCFMYSREKGPKAYNLPKQIPWRIKKQRYNEVMRLQRTISEVRLRNFIGKEIPVIIDEKLTSNDYRYKGRTEFDAPEIDGAVYIKCSRKTAPNINIGDIIKVKITAADSYDLFGEVST
ncbi:MAG: 30S ribosomal protein S12 methylthiotransferase RimO [candidate division WOR-3 bacterium]